LSIEGYEFTLFKVTLDINLIVLSCITSVLDGLVVMSGPEERNISKRYKLSKHVESSVRALIHSRNVMLDSLLLSSLPVGIRCDISSSEDIFNIRLKVRITDYSSPLVKLDS